MKKTQIATQLPVLNQTEAKSQNAITGSQSKTSESHGNQAGHRSKAGFLPSPSSLLPFFVLCSLFSVIWIACDNPSSNNNDNRETDDGVRTFVSLTYQQVPPAFLLTFDKAVPELSKDDIAVQISQAAVISTTFYTVENLAGPLETSEGYQYTLPVSYNRGSLVAGSVVTANARLSMEKAGYAFSENVKTADITFVPVQWESSVTAYPLASTNTKTQKIVFEFDRDIPDFDVSDITLDAIESGGKTGTTAKTGITPVADHKYELLVSGLSPLATGAQSQRVSIVKNGYYFKQGGVPSNWKNVSVYYEQGHINSVSITADPEDTAIPESFSAWPKTWQLAAALSADDGADTSVSWELVNSPVTGVTLTPNGMTATLSIAEAVTVGTVTVKATSTADVSKTDTKQFSIGKNAVLVSTDGEFAAALNAEGNLIVINSAINTPSSTTVMGSAKTIEIRAAGTLAVAGDFTAKGTIDVKSGGKIEIAGGKTLTVDGATSSKIVFGDVEFISGTYKSNVASKTASLSYTSADKSVTLGGDSGAALLITPNPVGSSGSWKYIHFPVGYSFVFKQGVVLDINSKNLAFDFGNILTATKEAGFVNGRYRSINGDTVVSAVSSGLDFKGTASNVYLERGYLYCAPGKELRFPAAAGSYHPPTLKYASLNSSTYVATLSHYEIASTGGAKITVLGSDAVTLSNNIGGYITSGMSLLPEACTLKIETIGNGGTLSFTVVGTSAVDVLVPVDLGGNTTTPVGSIVLQKNGANIFVDLEIDIKTGNTAAGDATYSFSASNLTVGTDLTLKGTVASGAGKLESITNTGEEYQSCITNGNISTDFVIDSTTVVTGAP